MDKWFLSYSSKDTEIAEKILEIIESAGNKCFYAPRDIAGGDNYAGTIMRELEPCTRVILVLSQNSNDSQQVIREINVAVNQNKKIVPIKIGQLKMSDDMTYYLGVCQIIDITGLTEEQYGEIIRQKVCGVVKKNETAAANKPVGTTTNSTASGSEAPKVNKTAAGTGTEPQRKTSTTATKASGSNAEDLSRKHAENIKQRSRNNKVAKKVKIPLSIVMSLALFGLVYTLEDASVATVSILISVMVVGAVLALSWLVSNKIGFHIMGIFVGVASVTILAMLIFGLLHFILPVWTWLSFLIIQLIYWVITFFIWVLAE